MDRKQFSKWFRIVRNGLKRFGLVEDRSTLPHILRRAFNNSKQIQTISNYAELYRTTPNHSKLFQTILNLCVIFLFLFPSALPAQTNTPDSISQFGIREFDQHRLDSFRNHPDFNYEEIEPEKIELTWFQRQWINLLRALSKKPDSDSTIDGWDIFIYVIAALALVAIVLGIAQIGIKDVFARKSKLLRDGFVEVQGDIQAVDFETLMAEALQNKAYRTGVRLLYLETLKILTLYNHIMWQPNKTNQEYLEELSGSRFQHEFDDLTLSYEYVCYGDWTIDLEGFKRVEKVFRTFQEKVGEKG